MIIKKDSTSENDFQFLEDMATAYWYSEALFTAIELDIFYYIEHGQNSLKSLAHAIKCRQPELSSLIRVLTCLELILLHRGKYQNSQITRKYLIPGSPDYMGDFLMYRRYLQPQWNKLTKRISCSGQAPKKFLSKDDDYRVRNFYYVRSLNQLAQQKAIEIASLVSGFSWKGPILDIGGGAGALSREIIKNRDTGMAVLFEIPEVIQAAKEIIPRKNKWNRVLPVAGDFRFNCFKGKSFGMVIMSNFLHTYNAKTARRLLFKAVKLLNRDGIILIHDYFPDRKGRSLCKGALYDLNMMLNTYEGKCHTSLEVENWLEHEHIEKIQPTIDLKTDTSIIIAGRNIPTENS